MNTKIYYLIFLFNFIISCEKNIDKKNSSIQKKHTELPNIDISYNDSKFVTTNHESSDSNNQKQQLPEDQKTHVSQKETEPISIIKSNNYEIPSAKNKEQISKTKESIGVNFSNYSNICYLHSVLQMFLTEDFWNDIIEKNLTEEILKKAEITKSNLDKRELNLEKNIPSIINMNKIKSSLDIVRLLMEIKKDVHEEEKNENYKYEDKLKKKIQNLRSFFALPESRRTMSSQEDAHEFLGFLVGHIHRVIRMARYEELNFKKLELEKKKETLPEKIYNNESRALNTYIKLSFPIENFHFDTIKIKKCGQCKNCETSSIASDNYLQLSLEEKETSLNVLFENLFNTEIIEGFSCDNCKKKGSVSFSTLPYGDAPEYIVVQLKRFDMNGSIEKKVKTLIQAPTSKIKLSFYNSREEKTNIEYEAISSIIHYGDTIKSGHYAAIRKVNEYWYKYDDMNNSTKPEKLDSKKTEAELSGGYLFLLKKVNLKESLNTCL